MTAALPELPERGSLDALPLPHLFLELTRRSFSGALLLTRDEVEKRVLWQDGVPVLAESNVPSESLGIQLLDAGAITQADHERLVETIEERGCKEGTALLGLQLVAPVDLFAALKLQLRRRVLECFGWPRGLWALEPGEVAADAVALRYDPLVLVREGLALHWSAERLLAASRAKNARYATTTPRASALAERLGGGDALAGLLESLDGRTAWGPYVGELTDPLLLAAVWLLDVEGALDWRDEPAAAPEPDAPPPPEAPPEIEIVLAGAESAAATSADPRARAVASGRAASASQRGAAELRGEIEQLLARIADLDHYEALGVEPDAKPAEIKRAYFSAAKRFHPDALARMGLDDVREEARRVFARIAQAHQVLSDAGRRAEYDRSLAAGAEDLDAARLVQAETLYRKAEILMRAGNFAGALEFLGPAVELWPDECAYQSALGWALYKKQPPDAKTASQHLELAVALDERDAVAHLRLGTVLRALGEKDRGAQLLARARQLDPKVQ
ncbi:MAG: DnaJ domain-containing protein [Myxococcota bacterium]|nr:DnaJ domain-containing protein [Myxococcota bacterium]